SNGRTSRIRPGKHGSGGQKTASVSPRWLRCSPAGSDLLAAETSSAGRRATCQSRRRIDEWGWQAPFVRRRERRSIGAKPHYSLLCPILRPPASTRELASHLSATWSVWYGLWRCQECLRRGV